MSVDVSIEKSTIITKAQQQNSTHIITKNNQEESPSEDQKVRITKRLLRKEKLLSEVKVRKEFNEEESMEIQAQSL